MLALYSPPPKRLGYKVIHAKQVGHRLPSLNCSNIHLLFTLFQICWFCARRWMILLLIDLKQDAVP